MTRREFVRKAGLAAAAAAWARPGHCGSPQRQRPNIVLILTDDQRWDALSCAGNAVLKTPHMDRLAAEGVRFENAFVTTPICAASRASIFTGLYERTHGYTFATPPVRAEHVALSYPAMLRAAGYRTGFVGKFGIGLAGGRKATARMFDSFRPLGRSPYFKKVGEAKRHATDITADRAIEFLDSCKQGRPFSLSVSFNAPHAEDGDKRQYIWPPSADGLFEDVEIPPPPLAGPRWFDAQPAFVRKGMNRIRWRWRFDTPVKYRRMVKGYYRMIAGVDAAVGRIGAALAKRGLDRDTVVIFTSDNGYFLGERGFAGKWLMYEPSLRVPLIVCDPRSPAAQRGTTRKQMALNIDLSPTVLGLAGLSAPKAVQGQSLLPPLRDAKCQHRREFLCEHLFKHRQIPRSEGIRTERRKYFRYLDHPGAEELYDLASDPQERTNLAGRAEHQAVLERMRKRCDEMVRAALNARPASVPAARAERP